MAVDVDALKSALREHGLDALYVDDLTPADLDRIEWSGSPLHIQSVRQELLRVSSGEVEYLAVRTRDGWPVAKGGIDYAEAPAAGTLWQLATHPDLQSMGIGTLLIGAAEQRIMARGLKVARLSVEQDNLRAMRLYERLGYKPTGTEHASWKQQTSDGRVVDYHTICTVMTKTLEEAND